MTTTVQENTQSAGHQFDVIVRADDVNVLNENAYAALHDGDTYFSTAGAKLEAWKLKYRLDNDYHSFVWVSHNGVCAQGTEFIRSSADDVSGAEYPYCWKHHESKRYTASETPSIGDVLKDKYGTTSTITYVTVDNVNSKGVIYWMKDEHDNECPYDFKNIMFRWTSNIPQSNIVANVFYYTFSYTTNSNDTTVKDLSLTGRQCYKNKIEPYKKETRDDKFYLNFIVFCNLNNGLDAICFKNTFDVLCHDMTFASCNKTTFGKNCYENHFGSSGGNIFKGDDYNIISDDYFSQNIVGKRCSKITFGYNYRYIVIEDYCSNITFGNPNATKSYCQNIVVERNCKNFYLDCSATTSYESYFQNIKIMQNINTGTSSITITHPTANDKFITVYNNSKIQFVSV